MKTILKIGEKIRIVRQLEELSQNNVATQLGITQQAYQKLENGKTIMTETKLTEIAKIFNVTEQEIRDIDKVPIINKNIRHCQQFGNYRPVYHNDKPSEIEDKSKGNEVQEMKNDISLLKSMFETLISKLGGNNGNVLQ